MPYYRPSVYDELKQRAETLWLERNDLINQRLDEGAKDEPDEALMRELQKKIDEMGDDAVELEENASAIYNDPKNWPFTLSEEQDDHVQKMEASNP